MADDNKSDLRGIVSPFDKYIMVAQTTPFTALFPKDSGSTANNDG